VTEIMVSKRSGIAVGPDGVKHRVHRGKTLADARHPLVQSQPNDWSPMQIELNVEGDDAHAAVDEAALEELRSDLAEVEELAEARGSELQRLADGLAARGLTLPAEDDRAPGWLVDVALEAVDLAQHDVVLTRANPEPAPVAAVPAPRAPRAAKPKPRADG
jgi:hypothetical protein